MTCSKRRLKLLSEEVKNKMCSLCGKPLISNLSIDHIIPRSLGGVNKLMNLILTHKLCNEKKGDRLIPCQILYKLDVGDFNYLKKSLKKLKVESFYRPDYYRLLD